MKILLALAVMASGTVGWPHASPAQTAQSPTNVAVRVTEARKANAALMRQYTWTSRTDVIDQGQVKDIRIDTVNYSPDGQLQRSRSFSNGTRLRHRLSPVDDRDYQVPFTFTGKINKITLTIDRPKLTPKDEKKLMQAQRNNKASE